MEERPGFRGWTVNGATDAPDVRKLEARPIRLAVDSWERPSEMMEGVAWLIAATLLMEVSARSIRGALEHFGVEAVRTDTPLGVSLAVEDDWLSQLVRRDRLTAWKVGMYAQLLDHRLCAEMDNHAGQKKWATDSQAIVNEWRDIDDVPEAAAAMVVNSLSRLSGVRERLDALVRQAPEDLPQLDELRAMGGRAWPDWVVPLAIYDPVLGIKVALEGTIRRAAKQWKQLGQERRMGLVQRELRN